MSPSNPIRVLQIISGFAIEGPLGGIERFVVELVQALPPDIEPIVCGMWDYHTPTEHRWLSLLHERGIQGFVAAPWQESAPLASFWQSVQGTRRALAGQRVDLIHSHCQFGDPLALLMKRRLGARALLRTVHNEREWPRRPERRLLFSNLLAPLLFHAEIGVAQTVVAGLNRRPAARLLGRRAQLCYNSLNLQRFAAPPATESVVALRDELQLPEDAIVIGSVGRLHQQKGYPFLLDAMEAVVARFPQAHLLLVGDGTEAEALRARAAASPVAAHLHLTGPLPAIERVFALLDLFVSSSLWEGLPTVLLESMAAGVPVVATDVSGSRELVADGTSGRLVPAGDAAALAGAIVAALSDREGSRAMAQQARHTLERFDIRQAAPQHATLYRKLARGVSGEDSA